jgi:hypothetical protein
METTVSAIQSVEIPIKLMEVRVRNRVNGSSFLPSCKETTGCSHWLVKILVATSHFSADVLYADSSSLFIPKVHVFKAAFTASAR